MVGVPRRSNETPKKRIDKDEIVTGGNEQEKAHRKMEQSAMKGAKRGRKRQKHEEGGFDEFSNIGPI